MVFTNPQGLAAHRRHKHEIAGSYKSGTPKQNGAASESDAAPLVETLVTYKQSPEPEPEPISELDQVIQASLEPLLERYASRLEQLQTLTRTQVELIGELNKLWDVIRLLPGADSLEPAPGADHENEKAVTVTYSQALSEGILEKAEQWLEGRRNSFDAKTIARGLGVSNSTGNRLVVELRELGRVRLAGQRGRARLYASTTGYGPS